MKNPCCSRDSFSSNGGHKNKIYGIQIYSKKKKGSALLAQKNAKLC